MATKSLVKMMNENYVSHYITLDNREHTFAVFVYPERVRVYNLVTNREIKSSNFLYKNIFIGESKKNKMTLYSGAYGKKFKGNSILLDLGDNHYVYIGDEIFSFKTKSKIISYNSPVGNNEVPYPYAIDKNGDIYLMLEKVILTGAKREPYEVFYRGEPKFTKFKTRQITKRLNFF